MNGAMTQESCWPADRARSRSSTERPGRLHLQRPLWVGSGHWRSAEKRTLVCYILNPEMGTLTFFAG